MAPIGVYACFIEPERLVRERASLALSGERTGRAPLRIAVLADLQFERLGGHEREAIEAVMSERPDVILLTGDIHQGSGRALERQLPAIRALLGRLRAPGGVYAVQGDVESVAEARLVTRTGVELLVNRSAEVRVRDRRLTIAGVELSYRSPSARASARALERAPGAGDVRILLAHRPDAALGLSTGTRVDLTVAGHTHGGQLQLPLIGPPMIASHVPRDVGAGGLHVLDGRRRLYVSRGVGVERNQAPKLRLGAPPEVSLLTLR